MLAELFGTFKMNSLLYTSNSFKYLLLCLLSCTVACNKTPSSYSGGGEIETQRSTRKLGTVLAALTVPEGLECHTFRALDPDRHNASWDPGQ